MPGSVRGVPRKGHSYRDMKSDEDWDEERDKERLRPVLRLIVPELE